MFDMQARIELVAILKKMFFKYNKKVPNFKDVKDIKVNYIETFGVVRLVDTNLIVAVTTESNIVTVTNIDTRNIEQLSVAEDMRVKIIKQMLEFSSCIRY